MQVTLCENVSCQHSSFIDFACSSVICVMLPDNELIIQFCSLDLSTELEALPAYCGFIQYQCVNLVSTCVQICESLTATWIIAA